MPRSPSIIFSGAYLPGGFGYHWASVHRLTGRNSAAESGQAIRINDMAACMALPFLIKKPL